MPYKVSDAEKLAERASPLKELDGDLAATLRCLVGAGALLVRHLVAASRVSTMRREASVVALATLCHRRMKRDDRERARGAARAAPRDELVALPAALLLGSRVAWNVRQRDERVLARRLGTRAMEVHHRCAHH